MKQALVKVGGNPNVLVNLISRRVRQLTTTGNNRPLIEPGPGMGAADVALLEIIEDKMDYEMSTATEEEAQPAPRSVVRALKLGFSARRACRIGLPVYFYRPKSRITPRRAARLLHPFSKLSKPASFCAAQK